MRGAPRRILGRPLRKELDKKSRMRDGGISQATEQMGGDGALLNHHGWAKRWTDRRVSCDYARAALKLSGTGQDPRSILGRGMAYRTLAWQAKWRGDFAAAFDLCLKTEAEVREADNPVIRADVYSTLGVVHYSRGRLDLANDATDRGFTILEEMSVGGHNEALVDLHVTKATIQRYSGETARANLSLSRAHDLATGHCVPRVKHNIARYLLADRKIDRAHEFITDAMELAINSRNRTLLPYLHEVLGAVLVRMKNYDEALQSFERGEKIARADEDKRAECQILLECGRLEMSRDCVDRALRYYNRGTSIAWELGYQLWRKTYCLALAEAYEKKGDLAKALKQHKLAWQIAERNKR